MLKKIWYRTIARHISAVPPHAKAADSAEMLLRWYRKNGKINALAPNAAVRNSPSSWAPLTTLDPALDSYWEGPEEYGPLRWLMTTDGIGAKIKKITKSQKHVRGRDTIVERAVISKRIRQNKIKCTQKEHMRVLATLVPLPRAVIRTRKGS